MSLEKFKSSWRRLDNTAKIFSLDSSDNINIFRYSIILKEDIDADILRCATDVALQNFLAFKVKIGTGLFWNYLEFNPKDIIIEEENDIPCGYIDFKKNNDYLFKVSYFEKKINVDFFHVLTDGTGAIDFVKEIIYNYLKLKYELSIESKNYIGIEYEDQYLKNYDMKYTYDSKYRVAYQLPGKVNKYINNTYHYIVNVDEIKKVCRKYGVSITEYLTAIYVFSLYRVFHKRQSDKEIMISVPINLRKYYDVDTLSNFFVCMNINSRILEKKLVTFDEILEEIHKEFREGLIDSKVKGYLTRDVDLGMNISIRLVPLFIKKLFIKYIGRVVSRASTSTLSNVGSIKFDMEYEKYIDNVLVLVMPNKMQKIKCTVCSFNNKLNISLNSNIDDVEFQKMFFKMLRRNICEVNVESNNLVDWSDGDVSSNCEKKI